jgi:hypothetical protein
MAGRQAISRDSSSHVRNHSAHRRQKRRIMVKGRQKDRAGPFMAFIAGHLALAKTPFQHGPRHAPRPFRLGGDAGREFLRNEGGKPAEQLHERHDASDFDLRTQDKIAG